MFCQTLLEQDLDLVLPPQCSFQGGSLLGHGCPRSGAQGARLIEVPLAGLLAPAPHATAARRLLQLRDMSRPGSRLSTSPTHEHRGRLWWGHLKPLLRQPAGRRRHCLPFCPGLGGGRGLSGGGRGRGREQQGMLGG